MKKLICLLTVWIGLLAGCSKKNGSGGYCWSCEVTGGGQTRMADTCGENPNYPPQFKDANGNDLNQFCQRK